MNIKGLRVFVNIMKEGTLAKASNKVNLSQPAASRLLGLLEERLGGSLFIRHKSRLIPTAEGKKIYPEVVKALAIIDGIQSNFTYLKKDSDKTLRIACHSGVAHSLVIPAIADLAMKNSGIRTRLDVISQNELLLGIKENIYDIGIGHLPVSHEGIETINLCEVALYVALPISSPLCDQDSLHISDLVEVPYIALDRTSVTQQLVEKTLSESVECSQYEVSDVAAACHLVQQGVGFTIADPFSLSGQSLDSVQLVSLCPQTNISLGAFLKADYLRHPSVEKFLSELTKKGSDLMHRYI